jgi:hypothetical protein
LAEEPKIKDLLDYSPKTQITAPLNLEKLCISLVKAESEQEVVSLLEKTGIWYNDRNWTFFGKNENNFSTVGNQASFPETAIAEKIVNSVDAVLMRECQRRKIDPASYLAPQTIVEAVDHFFCISQGSLSRVGAGFRTELAKNICLVATGRKESPCYIIADLGEGQTPKKMPETLLSITASNKMRIPFVQGKFNMGGTGVLRFCGRNNLQLIVTRRDPLIAKNDSDETKDYWGFTIVRREDPKEGRKSSTYTYLIIDDKIPMFKSNSLPILPGNYPIAYQNGMEWGTYIKLYDYQISGRLKSIVSFDLYDRLCLLLPKIALPVRFFERREGYRGHSMESTMAGLSVRLDDDRNSNLEENFPSSSVLNVSGENIACQIFAFKPGQSEKYMKDEGIIFTVNGQTHGDISKAFFERKAVNMSYLSDSILVTVDCSELKARSREDLFMNSRDRLSTNALRYQIERQMEELIAKHPGLRALSERRRREEIQNKFEDSKPLQDVLEKLIKKSPELASLFIPGYKLKNPFDLRDVGQQQLWIGKEIPTFFKLNLDGVKQCPINHKFRVQYETDAANDYFDRDMLSGKFELCLGNEKVDHIIHLWNGLATLTVTLPENIAIGAILNYKSITTDELQFKPFESEFKARVLPEVKDQKTLPGERIEPPSASDDNKRQTPSGLSMPNIWEVNKNEWHLHQFNEHSALEVKDGGDAGYDFYVNIDNIYLLSELKRKSDTAVGIIKNRFKYAMFLVGFALLKEKSLETDDNSNGNIYKEIFEVTTKLSPIILPMIAYLGELEE